MKTISTFKKCIAITVYLCNAIIFIAQPSTPGTINIQGQLRSASGQIVPDGLYPITFRLYDAALSDVALWTEMHSNVSVQSGIFSTVLGKINAFNLLFDKPYFLGIKLGAEPEMNPRVEMTSTPYSFLAKSVENNSISTDKIQNNAVTIDKIAVPIISSINGISNDGGNINILSGSTNVNVTTDAINKTITISSSGTGTGGTGNINQLNAGDNITIQNPQGPFPTIGLKPNVLLGPSGSLGILNQNNASVASITTGNQGGFISLSNSDLINTFGVIGSTIDRQPLLYLNNRLGNQVTEIKADEFSSGMLTLKSVLNRPLVRLGANENTGGLLNVFNTNGLITTQLTTSIAENGIKAGNGKLVLNSVDNNKVLQLETNTAGGGILRLYNIEGTEALRLTTRNTYGGSASIQNRAGITVGTLNSSNEGHGRLFLSSANDLPTIGLATNIDNGGGIFTLYNVDGNETIKTSTFPNKQPYFLMRNRLSNIVAEIKANEFSDGELTLHSVLTNPTVRLTANDNAGGLVNVFSKSNNIAGEWTEEDGNGDFKLFNTEGLEKLRLHLNSNAGRMYLRNNLGNPIATLQSSEFSDGELILNSVLTNTTLHLGANDNAGGRLSVFGKNKKLAANLTENEGEGEMKIFNKLNKDVLHLGVENGDGILRLRNLGGIQSATLGSIFGGQFKLYDGEKEDQLRAEMHGTPLGAYQVLYNKNNLGISYLGVNPKNQEGLLSFTSATNAFRPTMELGGDSTSQGYLSIYNKNGQNTSLITHNEFKDGLLEIKNNIGIRSGYIATYHDGGVIGVTDGKAAGNDRAFIGNSLYGGRYAAFNFNTKLVNETTVQKSGEGIVRIVNPDDIIKSRVEIGGSTNKDGFIYTFNNKNQKSTELISNADGSGMISTFKDEKKQTALTSSSVGGEINVYNNAGNNTSQMGHFDDGRGKIEVGNTTGNKVARMTANSDGSGYVGVDNVDKNEVVRLTANTGKGGGIGVKNALTNDIVTISQNQNNGLILVNNANGINTSTMAHHDDGRGKIEVGSANGTKVARITANTDGSGYISVDNVDKNEVVRLTANTGKGGGIGVKNVLTNDIVTISQNQNNGLILVNNANGINTSTMAHHDDGRGKIEVGSANGTKVARMTAFTDGSGYIGVDNVDKLEVVRITANNGKGGGIGIKNPMGNDIINLTQTNANGTILVNNDKGSLLATITHNSGNGGFIGTKDQNGKDAVWLSTNTKGGGQIFTFNDLGKVITKSEMDANSRGRLSVHGASGNEIARIDAVTTGEGSMSIDNNAGKTIAGLKNHPISSGGYVFANDNTGKEMARMTTTETGLSGRISIDNKSAVNIAGLTSNNTNDAGYIFTADAAGKQTASMTTGPTGAGEISIYNKSSTNLAGLTMNTTSLGGYLYAKQSNGTDVARMSSLSGGGGYVSVDNTTAKSVSYLSSNTLQGGFIGVANSSGNDRARLSTNANGAGHISASNSAGTNVVALSVNNANHGEISTSNANGNIINAIGATGTGQGYIAANNSSGQERAFMTTGNVGGEIGVNDNTGKDRVIMAGSGLLEVRDVDGSYLSLYSSGSSANMILVDKFQHSRAEVKSGTILAKGPNGVEHSFMSSATAPNLGYIGVCNSNIIGSPVKAGMFTNANNQGVLFADIKNFKIDYPGKPDKQIWYGSLEGPELAAYIRGTAKMINGKANVNFPDYYIQVANASSMTVIVTPLSGKSKGMAVVKKYDSGFDVEELMEGTGSYDFDWEVKCVRKGHESFEVVRNKSEDPKPFIEETPKRLETRSSETRTTAPSIPQVIERKQ